MNGEDNKEHFTTNHNDDHQLGPLIHHWCQLPQFHSKLLQLALITYAITGSHPLNRHLIHPDLISKLKMMDINMNWNQ